MSFQTDWYAQIIAEEHGFYPVEGAKYDALELANPDWNFRIAKQFGDDTNCLFAIDMNDLEDSQK